MTDRRYLWRAGRANRRVHIENPETERAYCQVENNGGKPFDGSGAEIPAGRRLCQNCADLAGRNEVDYREPDVRVLLGERLPDAKPELAYEGGGKCAASDTFGCAGTVAPEQPKRGKRVNRSKVHRPKRSNVKYHMPFNDDLPSW